MVECPSCTKVVRSDNLKRHKNTCKLARAGSGFTLTPSSSGTVPTRKLDTIHEHLDENTSSSDESKSDESEVEDIDEEDTIADIVDEEEDEEDNYFWYIVYRSSMVKDAEHFLEACSGYLGYGVSLSRKT